MVLVLHLQLGPGIVNNCLEGEVSSVCKVTVDEKESAKYCKDDDCDDVDDEKLSVDGEKTEALTNRMIPLLWKISIHDILLVSFFHLLVFEII